MNIWFLTNSFWMKFVIFECQECTLNQLSELLKQKELKVTARIVQLFFYLISCQDWGSNGASQCRWFQYLCVLCVFIWNSLAPAKAFFGCSWNSWFLVIPSLVLLFQCVLALLQILTTWYLSCACLGLFKVITLLDLRVYFIFYSITLRWECVRLEYLYISCCCNIFSSSSEVHAIPVA